jgi:hypothetical protein
MAWYAGAIMLKKSLLALFASSLCLTACGGGDGPGGSGLDGTKDLLSLSDAEIIQFCEYSESIFTDTDIADYGCYAQGVYGSLEGGDCRTIYAACIEDYEPEPSDCPMAADEQLPACAAMITVAELESCIRAQSAQYNGLRNVDCSTTPEELNDLSELPDPPECAALDEKCPDFD